MRQELTELLERWPLGRDLDINRNSNVFVIGAYKGITTDLINQLYEPKLIRAFEPQDWAFKVLQEVALASTNIEAYNYGLGTEAKILPMGEYGTDACSFVNVGEGSREQGQGLMVPAEWAFDVLVDLAIINIEGYEFTLIPYLRQMQLLPVIKALAIQWHTDLQPGLSEAVMDAEIERLIIEDDFVLRRDNRPAWTYMTKVRD